jgi:hypothetical protein
VISLLVQTGLHQQPLRKEPPIESLARNMTCLIPPLGGSAIYHHHFALESNDECLAECIIIWPASLPPSLIPTLLKPITAASLYAYDLSFAFYNSKKSRGLLFCSETPNLKKMMAYAVVGWQAYDPVSQDTCLQMPRQANFWTLLFLPLGGCKRDTHTVLVPCIIYIFHLLPCWPL